MKQDRLRREIQEKYERSLFTPKGLKTFRIQPSIDNTSLLKVSCCLILLYLQSRKLKGEFIRSISLCDGFMRVQSSPVQFLYIPPNQQFCCHGTVLLNYHSINAAKPALTLVLLFACSIETFSNFKVLIHESRSYGRGWEVWVELCRWGLQTPTPLKTKIFHFATLFKTGDATL